MFTRLNILRKAISLAAAYSLLSLAIAQEPSPPQISGLTITNGQTTMRWTPYPAAAAYRLFSTTNLNGPLAPEASGNISGYTWTSLQRGPASFYQLAVEGLSSNALLNATLLNRLAYGPTPDEWERLAVIGPQAFIAEQLAPESISEQLDLDKLPPDNAWQFITATGTASSSTLYIYLTLPGEGFIDDLSLVAGGEPGVGANLLRNANFEAPLSTNDWVISTNHAGSELSTQTKHAGNASLHILCTSAGSTKGSALWQEIMPALASGQTYTLSYWYLPDSTRRSSLTVRLSGSGITSTSDTAYGKLHRNIAAIDDLRAWHVMRAVQSQRQLLEVLLQFLENHFVTQYSKSREYLAGFYNNNSSRPAREATQMEFKENQRWRGALLHPRCAFYDLLRLSAESPAMIIYLDTVKSKGNGSNIANENYARELLELFTFGVDNGYDQNDLTVMSRAWTGWALEYVDAPEEFNPFAPRATNIISGVTSNFNAISNLAGVWSFNYKAANHNNNAKTIFPKKTVPTRFGAPYAGRTYELALPARTGTNGIQDGYDVIAHLADQPFTQEFISVKFCRLFVHDDFHTGYDFTDPNLSAEGRLIQSCMEAWESGNPKGQVREVLAAIFNSALFRSHGGSMQKVKTPLEFAVSALRALRTSLSNGVFTANTDGYSLLTYLNRLGGMALFDRGDPDGYPEDAGGWISAGTLAERLRFVQTTLMAATDSSKTDGLSGANKNLTDPAGLLKAKLPSDGLSDAGKVADYLISIIYPAEGKANLDLYRTSMINFLNTADDGLSASPLATLASGSSAYDNRVRGAAAMLLTFPRFQEQ